MNSPLFHATVLSMFPEMFPGTLQYSLAGQALANGLWSYDTINIRDFGLSKHKNVDDELYGGGNGLVMRPDVAGIALDRALEKNKAKNIYYMSPRGKPVTQGLVRQMVGEGSIIILCGRFEGIDERLIEEYNATEISLGDFVLSGGEIAAMAVLDACVRLIPGVLANQATLVEESFAGIDGLLEYPLYTRPAQWRDRFVPEVLLSGNHQKIKEWRAEQSRKITAERRPDLLKKP